MSSSKAIIYILNSRYNSYNYTELIPENSLNETEFPDYLNFVPFPSDAQPEDIEYYNKILPPKLYKFLIANNNYLTDSSIYFYKKPVKRKHKKKQTKRYQQQKYPISRTLKKTFKHRGR